MYTAYMEATHVTHEEKLQTATSKEILAVSESASDRETVTRMLQFAIAHGQVKTSEQLRQVSDMALGIAKIDGLGRPTPASYGEALQYETLNGLMMCGTFNEYADVRKRAVRVLDAVSGNPESDGE